VEKPEAGKKLDTEYVTDVVIRLRDTPSTSSSRRTIEVEKARGFQHVRGEQDIVIRAGRGTRTGRDLNSDDPQVPPDHSDGEGDRELVDQARSLGLPPVMSYIHVLRSLHSRSRRLLASTGSNPPLNLANDVV